MPAATILLLLGFFLRTFRLDSVPAGLTWDEGGEGLDAADVLQGHLRVFFTNNGAHEPVPAYLHAAFLKAFGWTAYSLRLPNVFVTTLALAATFLIARRLFSSRVAWLATFFEAVSFWQLASTRLATRAPMLIIFGALAVYWLVEWLEGRHPWRSAILCGACTGLAQYVYTPARFLVIVVGLAALAALVRSSWIGRGRLLRQGAALAGTAAAVFAPLGWYFLRNPDDFTERANQVSIFNTAIGPVWLNALNGLKTAILMFGLDGEPGWDRDIPHQPMFNPVLAACFFVGIILALRHWRQPRYQLVLIWLAVMLLPTILTSPGWPDFGRAMGIVPAMFLFPAITIVALWQRWPGLSWVLGAGAAALVTLNGWQYFGVWAGAPGVQLSYRPRVLQDAMLASSRVEAPNAPAIVYLGEPDDHDAVTGFVISGVQALRPRLAGRLVGYDGQYTTVLAPAESESYVAGGADPAVHALPPVRSRVNLDFENAIHVAGYDLPAVASPGEQVSLRVLWRPGQAPAGSLTLFAHLLDYKQQGAGVGFDHNGFPPEDWRGGESVLSNFPLALPPDLLPGVYLVEFGAYDGSGRRLANNQGQDRSLLGPITVAQEPTSTPATIADLSGYAALSSADVHVAGTTLYVTLSWLPEHTFDQDYAVFVHVLDASGKLVAQADGPPADGRWPTAYWLPGTPVTDEHRIAVAGIPAGQYSVSAGMYLAPSGQRLASSAPGPEPDSVLVGRVSLPG